MKHDHRSLLALVLSACLLAGCTDSRDPDAAGPERDNVVRAWLSADPASLSLIGKMDYNSELLAAQITDSLVQYDPRLELQPRVAESWEVSADRRTVTFRLREGVRWHDGTPVTAHDVVFTVDKVRDPAVENKSFGAPLREVEAVEAIDDRTVRARYASAVPPLLEDWRVPLIPRHLAGADEDLLSGAFSRHPVGCGPFRFVSYRPGQEIALEANDDYWDGRPQIDRLLFKIYPDQNTAYQALITGDLDIMKVSPSLWAKAQDTEAASRLGAFVYSTFSLWPVVWNQDGSNPFFSDARVRQAMLYALDREQFIETVAHGLARAGATSYHPETVWADPSIRPRPYDPALAARLLDEAGWSDTDGDGIRDKNGRPFRFTLLIPNSPMQLAQQIAVWQQHSWAQIGVEVEIERLEWQAFRQRRNNRNFEAVSFRISFTPNPDHFDLYHSSMTEGGFNFAGLKDAEIDVVLEEGRLAFDVEQRVRIFHRLQNLVYEREPMACTFFFASPVLHDRQLAGIVPSPLDFWRTTEGPRGWWWADVAPAGG